MTNKKPVRQLPTEEVIKHKVHTGDFKQGDYLIGNHDGSIYSVSSIDMDRVQGLEVRLTKERQDTENEISELWNKIHKNSDLAHDCINQGSNFLQDCIRENKYEVEKELECLRRTLFWITTITLLVMGGLGIGIVYLANKI